MPYHFLRLVLGLLPLFLIVDVRSQKIRFVDYEDERSYGGDSPLQQALPCDRSSHCVPLRQCRTLRYSPRPGMGCSSNRKNLALVCCPRPTGLLHELASRPTPLPTLLPTYRPAAPEATIATEPELMLADSTFGPPQPANMLQAPAAMLAAPAAMLAASAIRAQAPSLNPSATRSLSTLSERNQLCGQQRTLTVETPSMWPWMVSISKRDRADLEVYRPICQGFLTDRRHVLSAAHCFRDENSDLYQIRVGSVDQTRGGEVHTIVRIVTHEGYSDGRNYDDIAMLTLERPVTDPGFNPVCLPNEDVRSMNLDNVRATFAGWAQNRTGEGSNTLQQLSDMPLLPNEECNRAYRERTGEESFQRDFPMGITGEMLCAGIPEGRQDTCVGASGGPLMIRRNNSWYAVGVLSSDLSCGISGEPSVFTRVSEYVDWIEEKAEIV